MNKVVMKFFLGLAVLAMVSCADNTQIFPTIETSIVEAEIVLPNPISLAVNSTASQIYVANSNVDIYFDTGSLAVLDVDATDLDAPVLSATQVLSIPNFAGQMYFDGSSELFIPFRQTSLTDENSDVFVKYTLSASEFSETDRVNIADNPYALTFDGQYIYVVSENVLTLYETDLTRVATIDLTTADDADINDATADFVEDVVVNADSTKALVSNRGDFLFVVDLVNEEVIQVLDGPTSTRDMELDSNDPSLVYIINAATESIVVLDFDLLTTPTSTPTTLDDSAAVVANIGVGNNPNGLLFDADTNRLYVCNSSDNTISVIDTLTYAEVARISVDEDDVDSSFTRGIQFPIALALGTFDSEKYLIVAGFESNSIALIRLSSFEVVEIFPDNDLFYEEDEDN